MASTSMLDFWRNSKLKKEENMAEINTKNEKYC
jgi:hypothetical protein